MQETKEEIISNLKAIKEDINREAVSYNEISYLQDHKQEVLEFGDVILAQWADISEEEFNSGELRDYRDLFNLTEKFLKEAVSDEYAHKIALGIYLDVKEDVCENADVYFSETDVKYAIGRVLMDKFDLWNADFDKLESYIG